MNWKPEFGSALEVLAFYRVTAYECFAICVGTKFDSTAVFSSYYNDDINAGEVHLGETLDALSKNKENINIYTLVLIKYVDGINPKQLKNYQVSTTRFQLHKREPYNFEPQQPQNNGTTINIPTLPSLENNDQYQGQFVDYIKEENKALKLQLREALQKINDLQLEIIQKDQFDDSDDDDDDDDDPEELPTDERLKKAITGIIERPEIQEAAGMMLAGLAQRFFPSKIVE